MSEVHHKREAKQSLQEGLGKLFDEIVLDGSSGTVTRIQIHKHLAQHANVVLSPDALNRSSKQQDDLLGELARLTPGQDTWTREEFVRCVLKAMQELSVSKPKDKELSLMSRVRGALHSEGVRMLRKQMYNVLALMQNVLWLLLLSVVIQPDLMVLALLTVQLGLVVLCVLLAVASLDFHTQQDAAGFAWSRLCAAHSILPHPRTRYFRSTLFMYAQCVVAVVVLHLLVPHVITESPQLMTAVRAVNTVLLPVFLLLGLADVTKAKMEWMLLLALDVCIIVVPTSWHIIHALIHVAAPVVTVGTLLGRPGYTERKVAVVVHYLVTLLLRLQLVGNHEITSRTSYVRQLSGMALTAFVIAVPLRLVMMSFRRVLKGAFYAMLLGVTLLMVVRGVESYGKVKEHYTAPEVPWSTFSEQCGMERQKSTTSNMARVQLECRQQYAGLRVRWTGRIVRVDYTRHSTDMLKMLPDPFHTWARKGLRTLLGTYSVDTLIFNIHMDMDDGGKIDAVFTAGKRFEDVVLTCLHHGQLVTVMGEVTDVMRHVELRLSGFPGVHFDDGNLLFSIATWSMLPVYVPANATAPHQTLEEKCAALVIE